MNNINLDNEHFDYCDPETISHVRHMGWYNKYKQHKASKKKINEELLSRTWQPKRVWDWCMSEDEKEDIGSMFV